MTRPLVKSLAIASAWLVLACWGARPDPRFLLAATCDFGRCRPECAPHPAVARVIHAGFGSVWYGSGTLIAKDDQVGVLLTCAHLFRPGVGEVTVRFPSGEQHRARVCAMDTAWDLAALEIAAPAASPVLVAADAPRPGEPLESCGYGPDGTYRCNPGQAVGYVRTGGTTTYETLEVTGEARLGDSGGPVFNTRGELAAVVWGTDGRTVEATACCRIWRFLEACRLRARAVRPCRPIQPPAQKPEPDTPLPRPVPGEPPALDYRVAIKEFEAELTKLRGAIEQGVGRLARLEQAASHESLVAVARAVLADMADPRGVSWSAMVMPTLTALGWTGPPAVAAVLLARLGLALVRRSKETRKQDRGGLGERRSGQTGESVNSESKPAAFAPSPGCSTAPADPVMVRQENPPPPPQIVRERTFVPYQAPSLALEALRWAQEEYVRRYPAARSMIETIDSYAQQYESGQRALRKDGA